MATTFEALRCRTAELAKYRAEERALAAICHEGRFLVIRRAEVEALEVAGAPFAHLCRDGRGRVVAVPVGG